MRSFNYLTEYPKLLTPEIVAKLAAIHECKGKSASYTDLRSDALYQLTEIAKIQSTDASNRIEGIVTTDDRLRKIVRDKTMPKTRSEKEIAGYRDVLSTIHERYEYIPVKPSIILQLHRDLYKFSGLSTGGQFKNSDNRIVEIQPDGSEYVRFDPLHAWEVPGAVDSICEAYDLALGNSEIDPLLIIPMFILDFLCVHPFSDGNGRMSRLLTLLLLYRADYDIGKYISIEKLIADSKTTYYEVLQECSQGWHEGTNEYAPFVSYLLGIIIAAYKDFESRMSLVAVKGVSKPDRVRDVIRQNVGQITKSEIMEKCPDISQITVQRTLAEMLENKEITKIGGGRYTSYVWNGDKQ